MKEDESQTATTTVLKKDITSDGGGVLFGNGKGKYKFWVLAAILLLAFWSMFTGSVTLKWSAGNLNPLVAGFDSPIHDDLDVLELEEREKVVRHMWDVYTHSSYISLPRFWQDSFQAAYEDLTSDQPTVRSTAISEIAKMSLRLLDVDSPPAESATGGEEKKEKKSSKVQGKLRRRLQ